MKQLSFTRLFIGTATLVVSSAACLMAQSEVAYNTAPNRPVPFVNELPKSDGAAAANSSLSTVAADASVDPSIAGSASSAANPLTPGTTSKSTLQTQTLKPPHESLISVKPDTLTPIWANQPYAYLTYGVAPAVVLLTFGHK